MRQVMVKGALFGLCGAIIIEAIRWWIDDQRTWSTMLWSSWLIVFGAVAALSVMGTQRRVVDDVTEADPEERSVGLHHSHH